MVIDIFFLIILAFAILKGISHGFVVAVFSFFAIIIGAAAAMKLSFIAANWLRHSFNTGANWLPFISFLIVFVIVVLLVRLVANLIQASLNIVMLGWLNKLGGVLLYVVLYLLIYSIVLFYLTEMHVIKPETIAASKTYNVVEPFGPRALELLGKAVPIFRDIFQQLQDFFGKIAADNV